MQSKIDGEIAHATAWIQAAKASREKIDKEIEEWERKLQNLKLQKGAKPDKSADGH
ncbi:hypothetical protein GW944_00675 [Candidatus Parcubacteria bacterium]|nr:hypothetical protein [Candidatus Parcubacteria bacterium]